MDHPVNGKQIKLFLALQSNYPYAITDDMNKVFPPLHCEPMVPALVKGAMEQHFGTCIPQCFSQNSFLKKRYIC